MEYREDYAIEVAIKTLNQCPTKNDCKDFQREISVMKVPTLVLMMKSIFESHRSIVTFVISATRPPKYCQNHNIDRHTAHSNHNGIREARVLSQISKFQ